MASVTLNQNDVRSLEASLSEIKLGSKDAIIAATNDSMAGVKTEAARLVGEVITAKISTIKSHFVINKMNKSDMTADITAAGKPLPLIEYSARSVVKGTSVQVLRKSTRSVIRHAFIATMLSGHKGVFWRAPRKVGTGKWPVGRRMKLPSPFGVYDKLTKFQLPIEELYGPRIEDILDNDEIINPILDHASQRFDDRLEYHTERLLARARAA